MTCVEVTASSIPENAGQDGFSLLPLMQGKDWAIPRAPVIHHSANGMFSLRDGKWKIVFGNGAGGRENPFRKSFKKPYFLFDLESDPSETTNVINKYPEITERFEQQLETIMWDAGGGL